MRTVSRSKWESAMFNLDSMRTKLLNQRDEAREAKDYAVEDKAEERLEEVESLLSSMMTGQVTKGQWRRIEVIVAERRMERYTTCLAAGMDERMAAGAFTD